MKPTSNVNPLTYPRIHIRSAALTFLLTWLGACLLLLLSAILIVAWQSQQREYYDDEGDHYVRSSFGFSSELWLIDDFRARFPNESFDTLGAEPVEWVSVVKIGWPAAIAIRRIAYPDQPMERLKPFARSAELVKHVLMYRISGGRFILMSFGLLACLSIIMYGGRAWVRRVKSLARAKRNGCPKCGYDLSTLPLDARCPECGLTRSPSRRVQKAGC